MSAFGDKEPQEETWGDLSIKDLTQITYNNSFSANKTTPKIYSGESGTEKNTYSKPKEVDSKQYPSELVEVW